MSTVDTLPVEPATVVAAGTGPAVAGRAGALRAMLTDTTAVVGLVVVGALAAAAVAAPVLSPHDPNAVDVARKFLPPSREFPLGTDQLGRDVLSRLLFGARLSIGSTLLTGAAIVVLGVAVGVAAGWFGGVVDAVFGRLIDTFIAFPTTLLALAVTALLGPGLDNVMIAVAVAWWPGPARIARSAVLTERSKAYLEAAAAVGASPGRIVVRHMLPNMIAPIVVLLTLELGSVMLAISSLSFLGLGVGPPAAEWGAMLSEGRTYLSRAPNMMFFPGAAVFLVVLGFNLMGDGLRDALDPRTRRPRT